MINKQVTIPNMILQLLDLLQDEKLLNKDDKFEVYNLLKERIKPHAIELAENLAIEREKKRALKQKWQDEHPQQPQKIKMTGMRAQNPETGDWEYII